MHEEVTIKSGLTVEHVPPQQWYEFWPLPDGSLGRRQEERLQYPSDESERRDRMLHTIGNLTLLTGRVNTEVRNHAFGVKVPKIEGYSLLALNGYFRRRLAEGEGWDEDAIVERGRALFEMAKVIWPHPES